MLALLERYKQLPRELRDKMSEASVLAAISSLEKKYSLDLSIVIMRIVLGDIKLADLENYLLDDLKLDAQKASALASGLEEKIFNQFNLQGKKDKADTEKKEAGLGAENIKQTVDKLRRRNDYLLDQASQGLDAFSRDDEKEINAISEKMEDPEKAREDKVNQKIDNILNEVQISFASQLLAERFKNILKTSLLGARGKIEIREALLKPIFKGGMNMEEKAVENILAVLEKYQVGDEKTQKHKNTKTIKQENTKARKQENQVLENQPIARDVEYDLASELKKRAEEQENKKTQKQKNREAIEQKNTKAQKQKSNQTANSQQPIEDKKTRKQNNKEENKTKFNLSEFFGGFLKRSKRTQKRKNAKTRKNKIEREQGELEARQRPVPRLIDTGEGGKVRMDDIKQKPKTMGPIDELRYMDLVDFRRLRPDPYQAIIKIKQKIDLLESYKYSQKIEGIKAWRMSPVNKLYLMLGQESIVSSRSVGQIIESLLAQGQDSLTQEEFNAITRLNKELRF